MGLSADCMYCLISRQAENLDRIAVENKKAEYLRAVLHVMLDAAPGDTAPVVVARLDRVSRDYFEPTVRFEELKKDYNKYLLAKEEAIEAGISTSEDALLSALKLARAGNYIDFGAMKQIDDEKLDHLLNSAMSEDVNPDTYAQFVRDLEGARRLTYLTDNCGEIVLDKLLIRRILERFPNLSITVITRGEPVLNDATEEDAAAVGLPALVEVIGNGTAIAGTQLDAVSDTARRRILEADVVISKGQGNFETLQGCGLNVYYLFLCKCDRFTKRFGLEKYKGVFIPDRECAADAG